MVFDLSSSLFWSKPPRGVERVERRLAMWARDHLPSTEFVFYHRGEKAFRRVTGDLTPFLTGQASMDVFGLPSSIRSPPTAPNAARVPWQQVLGPPLQLTAADTFIAAGVGWLFSDIDAIAEMKARIGFRLAFLCYDLTPIKFQALYSAQAVENYRTYLTKAFALADRVIVSAKVIEADVRAFCAEHGIADPEVRLTPFGFDFGAGRAAAKAAPLPAGLEPGRFALFVSSIYLRKGHWMLGHVWRLLLAEGVPQRASFKLALVGVRHPGTEALAASLAATPDIVMLHDADDAALASLYGNAAFCLYPSLYEGYGLPIVEAFAYGKAVLASTGGSVPELAEGFSPCLDPTDGAVWLRELRRWIEDPAAREPYEQAIRERFKHPDWNQSAAQFFAGALT